MSVIPGWGNVLNLILKEYSDTAKCEVSIGVQGLQQLECSVEAERDFVDSLEWDVMREDGAYSAGINFLARAQVDVDFGKVFFRAHWERNMKLWEEQGVIDTDESAAYPSVSIRVNKEEICALEASPIVLSVGIKRKLWGIGLSRKAKVRIPFLPASPGYDYPVDPPRYKTVVDIK